VPITRVRRFADPDQYAAFIRGTRAEFSITKPGYFAAKLTQIDLHQLWTQRYSETLPRVVHFEDVPGRAFISFHAHPGPSLLWDGGEASPATIMRHSDRHSGFQRSTGFAHFASMSLPVAAMEALGARYGGADFTSPRAALIFSPDRIALKRLQSLHAATGQLAEHAPHVIAEPEAARGLEQALMAAMADCLSTTDGGRAGVQSGRHALIMRKFWAVLQTDPDRVLYTPEICEMIGTSHRTLNTCCNEAVGMSPHRYLRLRQLNLARRALVMANPATAKVTEIATAHGFWELGRFAVAYRTLFGESPSTTLRRTPGDQGKSPELAGFLATASRSA
jgi:AraC-like DNA-binding protein